MRADKIRQRRGQGRQAETVTAAGIGAHHRLTAAAGENHQAVSLNRRLAHQLGQGEELRLAPEVHQAALAAGGGQHFLIGAEGGGVGLGDGRGLRPHVGHLQENGFGRPAGRLQEAPAFPDTFEIEIDRGGPRVLQEIGQGLVFRHVQLVAQAQEFVDPQAFPGHPE
ncbi:MAG: hypothetical protein ABSG90_13515 [Dehalococcoidia bacterium]